MRKPPFPGHRVSLTLRLKRHRTQPLHATLVKPSSMITTWEAVTWTPHWSTVEDQRAQLNLARAKTTPLVLNPQRPTSISQSTDCAAKSYNRLLCTDLYTSPRIFQVSRAAEEVGRTAS